MSQVGFSQPFKRVTTVTEVATMVANILTDPKVITGLVALAAFVYWRSASETADLFRSGGSQAAKGAGVVYGDVKGAYGTVYSDAKRAGGQLTSFATGQGSDAKSAAKKAGKKAASWLKRRF